jgi:hypothetical protein
VSLKLFDRYKEFGEAVAGSDHVALGNLTTGDFTANLGVRGMERLSLSDLLTEVARLKTGMPDFGQNIKRGPWSIGTGANSNRLTIDLIITATFSGILQGRTSGSVRGDGRVVDLKQRDVAFFAPDGKIRRIQVTPDANNLTLLFDRH